MNMLMQVNYNEGIKHRVAPTDIRQLLNDEAFILLLIKGNVFE